jgi:AcrR family transcriptional regulator
MKHSERQKEIIKVSLELIAEHGIQGLTIKNISKKIGIVESAIYRHYESKTQILIDLLDSISDFMPPSTSLENLSVVEIIEQKIENHFYAFTQFPPLVSIVFSEEIFRNHELLVKKTGEKIQNSILDMTSLIRKGQNNGEIRKDINPEHFAIMVMGTIRMLVKQWKMSNHSFDLIQKGHQLIKSLKLLLKSEEL